MRKRALLASITALSATVALGAAIPASAATGGTAKAAALLAACKQVPAATSLGTPINVKSLKGKTIMSIPIDSKLEFYQVGEQAMSKIANQVGLKYETFPSDGTITSEQQGIEQAIATHVGVILLNGPLPKNLAPQIKQAVAAGIQVIPLHLTDKSQPNASAALKYEAFAPFNEGAARATDAAIADLKGQPVHALVLSASDTGPNNGMVGTISNELAKYAPAGSSVAANINSQVANWSTEIQPAVQSALLKDPSINAVIPIYDSMALFAIPGIKQAAANRNIGVYSFNGTPAVMAMIKDGTMRMDAAENPDWVAHVNLDTAFRAMLKAAPIKGESGPLRCIDASNVAQTGTPPQANKGFGNSYDKAYLKLWGLA